VEGYVTDKNLLRRAYVRPFLSWLPVVALVKDPSGRVLFGNGEFLKLIGPQQGSIVGKQSQNYIKDERSAELIARLDEVVRKEGRPILCIEHLRFEGEVRHRMAIRFPIPPGQEVELIGVLGFDLEQVAKVAATLSPQSNEKSFCEFSSETSTTPEAPLHCLKDFLRALPAIATLKNLKGRFLCVNEEFIRILGKQRSAAEGKLATQIWERPFANLISAHDELVRLSGQTFASVEEVPTRAGKRNHLTFRFPIFGEGHHLEMTGTLGFDYELLSEGIQRLQESDTPGRAYLFLSRDDRDSLKLVYTS
jgi:PAS domain-containing protein